MSFLSAIFGKRKQGVPDRLYVITGDPYRPFEEPNYPTDPRHYGLQALATPVSDEQFDREYRHKLKAFTDRDDAIAFAYHCNLDGVICPVYDRVGDAWVYNSEETGKVADDIN